MLRCEGLTQTYLSGGRELTVLKDITFTLEDSGFLAIVGPSGSGKTTLLGLLAGLDRPSRGNVFLDGADLGGMTEDQRARLRGEKVGFVFQSFQLIPTLTALENVQVPLELSGRPPTSGRASCSPASASPSEAITTRPSCPAASSSAWRWPAPSPTGPASCSPTNRPATSTVPPAAASWSSCSSSIATSAPPSCSSPTTSTLAGRARRIIRLADGVLASDSAA